MNEAKKIEDIEVEGASPVLPETGFVRLPTVLKLIPVGESTWYQWIKDGKAPKQIKLSARTAVWKAEDIKALIVKLGSTNDE